MTRLLLIDINILGIGAMREYEYRDRRHRGKDTGAIHGTLDKLASLLEDHADHLPLVLWDDRCRWREAILPLYKRHRWETPEQQAFLASYLAQVAVVRKLPGHSLHRRSPATTRNDSPACILSPEDWQRTRNSHRA